MTSPTQSRNRPRPVLAKLVAVEAKLLLREPGALVFGILFPSVLLLGLGSIPTLREPAPQFSGARFVDVWAPSALILGLGTFGLQHIPAAVASYREKGVLRRMSTTPVHPGTVLVAQLVVAFVSGVATALVLITSARLVLDVPLPQHPWWFALAFTLGYASLLAIGMLIAAVVPTMRLANGVTMFVYMVVMVLGGVFLPRSFFPDAVANLGDFTPPGVQALLDAWSGEAGPPTVVHLGTMVVIAIVAGVAAARFFRWE